MAYDGKATARARQAIARRKLDNEDEMLRRRALVAERASEALSLEREISGVMSAIALAALEHGDVGSSVAFARERCEEILSERAALLKQNGFDEDFLDEIYTCNLCRDTGYVGGKTCRCLEEAAKAEAVKELSSMLDIGDKCFERFDLSLYETPSPGEPTPAVQTAMLKLRDNCRDYSQQFGEDSVNLLFRGGTGLGKTFLSACIAKVVSEKGFSVVYDTCVSVIDAFETQKFERNTESSAESSSQVKRYLGCDLLILDDLGTEMTTAFTQSALYTLINTRLLNGKKTIISTNLSDDELERRYSPQIVSRLKGEYMAFQFRGRDIREVKKERGL